MSNIFKFYINNNNKLDNLYLFIKNKYLENTESFPTVQQLNDNYQNFEDFLKSQVFTNFFINDFSKQEVLDLNIFKPKIYFIDDNIYLDDTIETCKLKFIMNYNKLNQDSDNHICFEEIYFYGIVNNNLKYNTILNILTNNNKIQLTRERIISFLNNFENNEKLISNLKNNFEFTINDLIDLKLINQTVIKSIGNTCVNNKANIIYNINPYNNNNTSLKTDVKKIAETITTNNSNLIFEYGLINNSIFVCLFNDVIQFTNKLQLDKATCIKLYFPFLNKNEILSQEEFNIKRNQLLKTTNDIVKRDNFINKNKLIDLLYKIYYTTEFNFFQTTGIRYLNLNINLGLDNLSIESIFKFYE